MILDVSFPKKSMNAKAAGVWPGMVAQADDLAFVAAGCRGGIMAIAMAFPSAKLYGEWLDKPLA